MQHDFHFRFTLLCSHIAIIRALISHSQAIEFQGSIPTRNVLVEKLCSVSVIWVLTFQLISLVVVAVHISVPFLPVNYFIITRWERTREDAILGKQPCYCALFCKT